MLQVILTFSDKLIFPLGKKKNIPINFLLITVGYVGIFFLFFQISGVKPLLQYSMFLEKIKNAYC